MNDDTISVCRRRQPGERTLALARHLQTIAWQTKEASDHRSLMQAGRRLERCIRERKPCGHALCARCNGRAAKRYRRRLEADLAPFDGRLGLLTLNSAADEPGAGRKILAAAFAALRRRAVWKEVVEGGEAHFQLSGGTNGRRWNVHAHAALILHEAFALGAEETIQPEAEFLECIEATWSDLLGASGTAGSLCYCPIARLWA